MPAPKTLLVILLRIGGCAMVLAFPMALLPTTTMASVNEAIGLGVYPSPAAPLLEYLTRSISLLYGFHGALLLVVATDVVRFAPIVRYLGVMNVLFGLGVLAIDLAAGMPAFWTWNEGPPVLATGLAILYLGSRVGE